jgi:hypothetical protein
MLLIAATVTGTAIARPVSRSFTMTGPHAREGLKPTQPTVKPPPAVTPPTTTYPTTVVPPPGTGLNPLTELSTVDGVLGLYVGTISNISYWSPALAKLKPAGFGAIRVFLSWAKVETAPSSYTWANVDKVLQLAEANGLRVEFVVKTTPEWTQAGTADADRGPDDPARLTSFITAVCSRYRGRVAALQVWNEPNATKYFTPYPGLSLPESYVRILKAVYVGAKVADPGVLIIGGNMDGRYATNLASPSYAQDDFTAACYAAGAHGYFDIWATHNYPGSPSTRVPEFRFGTWAANRSVWGVVDSIRSIMDAKGDASKRLAISEVGWLNAGVAATYSDPATLVTQRRYTVRHVTLGLVRGIVSYQVMFIKDVPDNCKGVFDAAFAPRPVFEALAVLNDALRGCAFSDALAAGTSVHAYRFVRDDGRSVIVAWTNRGEYVDQSGPRAAGASQAVLPLPAGSSFAIVSLDGRTTGSLAAGQALPLTNDPVILVQD